MMEFFKQKGAAIYFAICMCIFLFMSYSQSEQNAYIDIPHIETNILPLYMVLFVMAVFVVILFNIRESQIDWISILLLGRLGLHFIPPIYLGFPDHFPVHFMTSIVCLCSYLIAKNMSKTLGFTLIIFRAFFFILAFQIVAECFASPESFWENAYLFKVDMALPIGASNSLAAKLVPFFALLFVCNEERKSKWLYFVVAVFAVVLTKSRGGMIDLLLVFAVASVWKGHFSLESVYKSGLVSSVIAFTTFYVLQLTEFGKSLFSDSDSTVLTRFDLWQRAIDLIKMNPVFGNGFYYGVLADNPHNFLLDLLARSGFVGGGLFFLIVVVCVFKIKSYIRDSFIRGCLLAVLCMFWQGLVEIVLFGYIQDLLMWMIIGCMISKVDTVECEKNVLVVCK